MEKKVVGKVMEPANKSPDEFLRKLPPNAILAGVLSHYVEASMVDLAKFCNLFKKNYLDYKKNYVLLFSSFPCQSIPKNYDQSVFIYENGSYRVAHLENFVKMLPQILGEIEEKEMRQAYLVTINQFKADKF